MKREEHIVPQGTDPQKYWKVAYKPPNNLTMSLLLLHRLASWVISVDLLHRLFEPFCKNETPRRHCSIVDAIDQFPTLLLQFQNDLKISKNERTLPQPHKARKKASKRPQPPRTSLQTRVLPRYLSNCRLRQPSFP